MKILFVTGLYPKNQEYFYRKNCSGSYLQNAPNNFQWAIVEGLIENECDFYVYSIPFLPAFPFRYKKLHISYCEIEYQGQEIGSVVPYLTFVGFKDYSIAQMLKNKICQWIIANVMEGEKFCILTYTTLSCFLNPIIELKKIYPNLILATIVTDLVDDMLNFDANRKFFKRIQVRREISLTYKNYKFIDKFILLTKEMEERIPESVNRNIVIEGIASTNLANNSEKERILYSILYSGTFQEYAGVKELVDAFHMTDNPQYKLILCGYGGCQNYVEAMAKIDRRIEYLGSMPHERVVALQRTVSLLVNPRKPDNSITKYSFPSKTMEYMLSGTPMLGYKLQGIPFDYYSYMYIVEDNTCDDLASKIDEVMMLPQKDLINKGKRAKEFVLNEKSSLKQIKKMTDFICM